MNIRQPTVSEMIEISEDFGLNLSEAKVRDFMDLMEPIFEDYETVNSMSDYVPKITRPTAVWSFPEPEENPFNAWYVRTEISLNSSGSLGGQTVALKDSICLAGVPMTYGTHTLDGYVPDIDATVVTRLLEAGAVILGKARCEAFCASGSSHTSDGGWVENPYRANYSAGGSSSGCGALVAAKLVDVAIGGDQGGSIRIPASYSGCYGLKPTHGLVPYSGVFPIDASIDHIGPMTQTVYDNAKTLQVIAGEDELDPRQFNPQVDDYVAAISRSPRNLRVGVVKEGFGWPNSEQGVDSIVRKAAEHLERLGMIVQSVSIPLHRQGEAIWGPIAHEGFANQMSRNNPMGYGWKGLYATSLVEWHARWRDKAEDVDDTAILSMLVGEYFQRNYAGYFYAKAQNLSRKLSSEYDTALQEVDLLLMPTTPMTAKPIPPRDTSLSLYCQRAYEMGSNVSPTNLTGHPAISIPCGLSEDMPVGMMLIGGKWQESKIYTAAAAFEENYNWQNL